MYQPVDTAHDRWPDGIRRNDTADAEAICDAATHPTMRFAPVKSAEQQSVLMLHRTRELLMRQRTMLINALRGHCAEFGLIAAQGIFKVADLIRILEATPGVGIIKATTLVATDRRR
tara:strand:+ start:7286 stop:7636 length:351 start_codon:yes stop_codon:yes gene_type:complete